MSEREPFVPIRHHGRRGFIWKAEDERGCSCLHEHQSERAAQRCCDQLNKPTPGQGTPQGAWDHASGYRD
jgi:hypothetical protein